ncbi:MAG TPA: secretion system protein E [Methanosarcinaceae archaeon]|nr:secretion system protein E [Methanosarcinaceae archaeon]
MERITNLPGISGLKINQSLKKLFRKQEQNEDSPEDPWLEKISHLPACSDGIFDGNKGVEYQLDRYCHASVTRHPDAVYCVVEPELTYEEQEIVRSLKNRMLGTVLASNNGDLEGEVFKLMEKVAIDVPAASKDRIIYYMLRDFTGYGLIDPLARDANIEDISCNGVGVPIYVLHRYLGSIKTNLCFEEETTLDNFVAKLALRCGKSVSVAKPILDAGLPDGNRVNITYGKEVTPKGSTFTIRKFKESAISPVDLIQHGTISPEMLAYLWTLIEYKSSIMVFGETGSGKTTLLNAFSLFIPPEMKIVSIEDTPEVRLPHENWIQSITRSSFNGKGSEITMFELLKASLRQRPDYIIVGEIRGEEANALFQAISTGQLGLSTMHASSAKGVVDRLTSPPMNIPLPLLSSIGCLCHQVTVKYKDGSVQRRTKSVTEIIMNNGKIELKPVFRWDPQTGFEFMGRDKMEWESEQIERISEKTGVDKHKIGTEMNQKTEMLVQMAENNIHDVAEMISNYYRNRGL